MNTKKKTLAVLFGGHSSEYEVSLQSAAAVLEAVDTERFDPLSIGITKDTAYRPLKISSMFESSSPRQQDILQELSPSLLYAAAKPSAPPELVEQVKSGDITSFEEYQELLAQVKAKDDAIAAEKSRADTAEAHLEAGLC